MERHQVNGRGNASNDHEASTVPLLSDARQDWETKIIRTGLHTYVYLDHIDTSTPPPRSSNEAVTEENNRDDPEQAMDIDTNMEGSSSNGLAFGKFKAEPRPDHEVPRVVKKIEDEPNLAGLESKDVMAHADPNSIHRDDDGHMDAPAAEGRMTPYVTQDQDVRRFIDLETEVDEENEDDDDDDGEDEMGEFLEDDQPMPADRTTSHRLLSLEHTRAHGQDDWDSLLARARERGREVDAQNFTHTQDQLPFTEQPRLWRVAVTPGREETVTFVLFEKILRAKPRSWAVYSVVGRASRPGWVVVEAAGINDVREVCQAVSNLFPQRIHVVEPDDSPACLKEPIPFIPRPQSWVRLTKRPYQGDLAYVKGPAPDDPYAVVVCVVPRINFQPGKHNRGSRPDRAMFDEKKVRDVWGQKSVVGQHQQFQFGGKSYDWGFLLLTTSDYLPSEAIPTSHDIILFQKLSLIPSEVFLRSIQMLAARRLKLGDPVKLVGGQSRGVIGVIEQIINDEAIIRIGYVTETVPVDDLRKHVEVGDEVLIVDGPHAGVQGWVVSTVEDSLVVYDHEALKEVVVRSDCVKFFEAPFIAVDLRPRVGDDVAVVGGPHRGAKGRVLSVTQHTLVLDNDKQGTAVEVDIAFVNLLDTPPATASRPPLPRTTRTRFGRDPNYRFIGNHVKVIKDGRFRGYKGIIKSTEDKDYVVVEIRATMQKEHIHLSSLALWNDPNMVPLNMKPSDTMNLAASTSTSSWTEIPETIMTTFEIPESRSLLVPSTPLPAGSSVSFSPPWNPSSRTPNATSAFPHNPWMESPSCAGIQVRVRIGGTKADLRDPGWKGGDYEDQPGLWNGTEGSMAKIIAGRRKTLLVPEKYVRPLRPSMQGQVVVSLEGPPIGEKWVVVKSDAENTRVGRRNKKGRIEEDSKQFLATKSLAVVVQ